MINLGERTRTDGNAKTRELFKNAEEQIDATISKKISAMTNQIKKNNFKNFLQTAVLALIILLAGSGTTLFIKSYKTGTQIAESRAEQALRERESEIATQAVAEYKASDQFVKDGATYVANNFYQLRILEIFYQEMPIKQKKELKLYDWLNKCHQEYKEKIGNK